MGKNNLIKPQASKVDVLMGLQWGDEGKGKIVDTIAPHYDVVARFGGGPNAGHSIGTIVLNQIPSGALNLNSRNFIGNGCVIDPRILKMDLEKLIEIGIDVSDRLYISERAKLITPAEVLIDAWSEHKKGTNKIGSTGRGISPTYTRHTARESMRVLDYFSSTTSFHKIRDHVRQVVDLIKLERSDGEQFVHALFSGSSVEQVMDVWKGSFDFAIPIKSVVETDYILNTLEKGCCVLAEGAQAHYLDIELGDYPYVTSSHTTTAGACIGLAVPPKYIGKVYGVIKAYATRVGNGPFDDEFTDDKLTKYFRKKGHEYGATTGRPRRIGWTNFDLVQKAIRANGVDYLFINKVDVLFNEKFKIIHSQCDHDFEGLDLKNKKPNLELENFIELVQDWLQFSKSGTKLIGIGTGPGRDDVYYL